MRIAQKLRHNLNSNANPILSVVRAADHMLAVHRLPRDAMIKLE